MVGNAPAHGLSKDLVTSRIRNFWGYGSLDAPVWFVGMEEGLSRDVTDVNDERLLARFTATADRQTVDLRRGMEAVPDHIKWFRPCAPLQSTWKYLIALYLHLKHGSIPAPEAIRDFQSCALADSKLKETAAIELMSLPSNKARQSTWLYNRLGVPGLSTRAEYLEKYVPERVSRLSALIIQHKPKLVVFYSLNYRKYWEKIIGTPATEVTKQMFATQANEMLFCVVPQGSMRGMSYARIHEYARLVAEQFPRVKV